MLFFDRRMVGLWNDFGYNVTRTLIQTKPLEILDKTLERDVLTILGDASKLFYEPQQPPSIQKDLATANIQMAHSKKTSVSLTVSFLKELFKDTGITTAKISAVLEKASHTEFKISDCSSDTVYPTDAWEYLSKSQQGGIDIQGYVGSRILDNNSLSNPAYLITETVKAKTISLRLKDSSNNTIKLDVESLLVKLNEKVKWEVSNEGGISLTYTAPMVFAFKAVSFWLFDGYLQAAPPDVFSSRPLTLERTFFAGPTLYDPDILTPAIVTRPETMPRLER